jgi:N-acetylneuraminate synthase
VPAFAIGDRWVGDDHPTYFIADISANHDGDLGRACELIHLAAQAGANAAKFQNFRASEIVSDFGFRSLRSQVSHQARWTRSVYEVYQNASIPWEWTPKLRDECDAACIDYFSTPYDLGAVDMLDRHVRVYKVGSGDITWPELMRAVAAKKKPVLLAAGASEIGEVQRAVDEILAVNSQLALLQCNTNYTVSLENFRYINLNVLKSFRAMFPNVVLGLSDHTPGHTTVLGAVALGARIVEKHFTDDTRREGPDHAFSMTPQTWREMVDRTRELELALGDPGKRVEENERETVVIQRRCVRAAKELRSGTTLTHELLTLVRPAPLDGIFPFDAERIIGRRLCCDLPAGEYLRWTMLEAD